MTYSNTDNYGATDKRFTLEHINSDDQNKTASDNKIIINSIEHRLSNSITSVENLHVKSCDCITRVSELSSYKIELQNRVTQNNVTPRVANSEIFKQIIFFE